MSCYLTRPLALLACLAIFIHWQIARAAPKQEPIPQPIEVIEETTHDIFSERAASWPSQRQSANQIQSEILPVFDSLNFLPGVQARDSGSPLVSLRGSGSLGRVLGLFEGIPLNLMDGTGAQRLLMPREIFADVSLLKGPASTFFGSDAMGGAFQFQARRFEGATVRLGAGSFGQRNSLVVGGVGSPAESFHQVSYFHEHTDGRYPFRLNRLNASGERTRNDLTLDRVVYLGEFQAGSIQVLPRLIVAREGGSTPGPFDGSFVSSIRRWGLLAGFTLAREVGPDSKLSLRSSWINAESDSWDSSTFINKTSRFQNSLSFSTTPFQNLQTELFLDSNLDQSRATPEEAILRTQHAAEVGVRVQWLLSSVGGFSWALEPSVRYLALSGEWVHALGLVQEEFRTRRWLLFSEGFRQPSFGDRFTNLSFYQGNPSLENERSFQVELGFQKQTSIWFEEERWGAALFSVDYRNLFQTYNRSAGVTSLRNDPSANTTGFELEFAAQDGAALFSSNLSYLETRSSLSDRGLPMSPRTQASARWGWNFGTFTPELRAMHWTEILDRDFSTGNWVQLEPWTTVDLLISSSAWIPGWKVAGGILNFLDAPRELTLGYPEPQRRLFVTMEHRLQ